MKHQKNYCFPKQSSTLASISLNSLLESQIYGAILDLDNTIVSEDDQYLSPGAEDWIKEAKRVGLQCYILSNGKRKYRVKYWSSYLEIPALSPAKKPLTKSFHRAIGYMNLTAAQVVVIGDSRHTDILGAHLSGCPSIQVASLPHPPRWWEKLLGRYIQTPYPKGLDLSKFQPSIHYKQL